MGKDDSVVVPGDECGDLVIEACLTRTLAPALTLEHGLQSLQEAVQDLKLNPPSCTSGMIRFEVAVPPSANACEWFCSQPGTSGVFPQFYICKELEKTPHQSALASKNYGIFGIGAAVDFRQSSFSSGDWNSFRRYLLVDSLNITAYGFIGINYDNDSSFMKRETGSCYFVVPQIELNEYEGFCMLAGTLVWGDFFPCNFKQALHSYEMSLFQATHHIPVLLENSHANFVESTVEKFNMADIENLEMIYMEAPLLGSCDNVAASVEMKGVSSSNQFCIRISPNIAVSANMLDHVGDTSSILQGCANINSIWASLIVEECSRLGLTLQDQDHLLSPLLHPLILV